MKKKNHLLKPESKKLLLQKSTIAKLSTRMFSQLKGGVAYSETSNTTGMGCTSVKCV
jgi:hypothetical protein